MQKDLELFIDNIRKDDRINIYDESNTKSIIINKFLNILGWDLYNHDEVELEYYANRGKVDYALKGRKGNTVFLEAKNSSSPLNDDHESKILSYARKEKVKLAILTNGTDWKFYLPFEQGKIKKMVLCRIYILQQDTISTATNLINLLSKNNVDSGKAIENAREFTQLPRTCDPNKWHSYLSADEDFTYGISSFCLNGHIYDIEKGRELLMYIIDIIYSKHKIKFGNILNVTGNKGKIYFSLKPKVFRDCKEILDTGIYVDVNLNNNNIVDLCVKIIEEFGYSKDDLKIKR